MARLTGYLRSTRFPIRIRDFITRSVIYGSVIQGLAMTAYFFSTDGHGPMVFIVGLIGPVAAALLNDRRTGVVSAPLAGMIGTCLYFLVYLAYGAVISSQYPYVVATWQFAGYVAMAITQGIILIPAFGLFGTLIGKTIDLAKYYVHRARNHNGDRNRNPNRETPETGTNRG